MNNLSIKQKVFIMFALMGFVVIASGVAVLVMFLTALRSLQDTADAYYERYRFAQVFATVKRAP